MKKSLFRSGFLLIFLFGLGFFASAQNGGKAMGKEIKFKAGATSATVNGTAKNNLEYEYTFVAKAGQLASIKITSTPSNTVTFVVRLNGELIEGEMDSSGTQMSFSLPEDGEYWVSVKRKSSAKGTSKYSMRLSIK